MSASKGWAGSLVLAGDMVKEEMEGSPAVAAQTTFYTRSFPVVNVSTRLTTDTEADVTVYVDDVAKLSTDFTLTGATGKIVFGVALGASKVVTITYSYTLTMGYVQNATPSISGDLTAAYEWGSRLPQTIMEGNTVIRVPFERAFIDRDIYGKVLGELSDSSLPEFTMTLYPLGNSSTKPYLQFNEAKCNTWRFNGPQNGMLTENSEFLCTSVTAGTVA